MTSDSMTWLLNICNGLLFLRSALYNDSFLGFAILVLHSTLPFFALNKCALRDRPSLRQVYLSVMILLWVFVVKSSGNTTPLEGNTNYNIYRY